MPSAKLAATRLRHVLNRFSYGVSPALVEQAQEGGGATAWFEQQLSHTAIADDRAAAMKDWYPYIWHRPGELWDIHESEEYYGWEMMTEPGPLDDHAPHVQPAPAAQAVGYASRREKRAPASASIRAVNTANVTPPPTGPCGS